MPDNGTATQAHSKCERLLRVVEHGRATKNPIPPDAWRRHAREGIPGRSRLKLIESDAADT